MIALPSQSVLKRIDDKGEINLPGKFTVWWLKKKNVTYPSSVSTYSKVTIAFYIEWK